MDKAGITMSSNAKRVPATAARRRFFAALCSGVVLFVSFLASQGVVSADVLDPTRPHLSQVSAIIDIGVLVFREGLECILVLAAITAGLTGTRARYQRPIALGAGTGLAATILTWMLAVGIVSDLGGNFSALALQAATGLLAVIVLLIVMNWFFHRVYWTGWISLHNKKKQQLMQTADDSDVSKFRLLWGMGLLGFSSFYREGFEVVLFLQSYRLKLGGRPVLYGALLGLVLSGTVAVLTFVAHRQLPYRRMLVLTGMLLGGVLLVMAGEQAQEMQLAHWLPTTTISWLDRMLPAWLGLWFSVFPTVETIASQSLAAALVIGSYFIAEHRAASGSRMLLRSDESRGDRGSPNRSTDRFHLFRKTN
jgi:high-affinity iron transporter